MSQKNIYISLASIALFSITTMNTSAATTWLSTVQAWIYPGSPSCTIDTLEQSKRFPGYAPATPQPCPTTKNFH